jgi:integrase
MRRGSRDLKLDGAAADEQSRGTAPLTVGAEGVSLASLLDCIAKQQDQLAALTSAIAGLAPRPELGSTLTVGALWADYFKTIAPRSWSKHVVSMMKAPLAHFGQKVALDLRPSDWIEYRDTVRGPHNTEHGRPPTHGTLNLELRRMKTLFNWAIGDLRIARNPFHSAKPLRTNKRTTIVSDAGLEAVLKNAGPMLRAIVLVAIDSGMRSKEIRLLKWSEIDFARGVVSLSADRTKTKKARRPRLTERALDAMRMLPRHVKSPFVFCNPRTQLAYSEVRIWQLWRDATAQAGLQAAPNDSQVHMHDLRHSLISRMARLGIPLFVSMANAGQESIAQNKDYTHVSEEDLDEAKRVLDAAILAGPRRSPQRAALNADPNNLQASSKKSWTP